MSIWSMTPERRASTVCAALAERLEQESFWKAPPWFRQRALKVARRWVQRQTSGPTRLYYCERGLFGVGPLRWAVVDLTPPLKEAAE